MEMLMFFFLAVIKLDAQNPAGSTEKSGGHLISRFTSKAEFPGGYYALIKFIQKNIQYPQMERDNDIQGIVTVGFLIDENGKVTNVETIKNVSPGLDKEAKRVVKLLPDFKPAMYNGKPVRVYYMVNVTFRLQ